MTDTIATGSLAGTERLDRQSLFLLFIGLFATAIGQAFVFAILPPLGRSVGLDEVRITAIISTSALVFTLVAPFWGRFSDKIGRKPVILIGLMGYCIGSLAFAVLFSLAGDGVITGVTLFIIALIIRSLQAATMSATSPGCTAYRGGSHRGTVPHQDTGATFQRQQHRDDHGAGDGGTGCRARPISATGGRVDPVGVGRDHHQPETLERRHAASHARPSPVASATLTLACGSICSRRSALSRVLRWCSKRWPFDYRTF